MAIIGTAKIATVGMAVGMHTATGRAGSKLTACGSGMSRLALCESFGLQPTQADKLALVPKKAPGNVPGFSVGVAAMHDVRLWPEVDILTDSRRGYLWAGTYSALIRSDDRST
jgi:hypothetical protein